MLLIGIERIFSVGHTEVFQMFTFRGSHSNVVHVTQFRNSAIQLRWQELPKYLQALSHIQKQIRQLWPNHHAANVTTLLTPALTFQTWKYANETQQFNSYLTGHILLTQCEHHHDTLCRKSSSVCNVACFWAFVIHLFRKNNEQNTLFMCKPPTACLYGKLKHVLVLKEPFLRSHKIMGWSVHKLGTRILSCRYSTRSIAMKIEICWLSD